MSIIVEVYDRPGNYVFYCPGCQYNHCINTITPNVNGLVWEFDGDMVQPTFNPSVEIYIPYKTSYERCHFIIINGYIKFKQNCTHRFGGMTMPLCDLPVSDLRYFRENKNSEIENFCNKKKK